MRAQYLDGSMNPDTSSLHRRDFLKTTSAAGLGALVASHGIGPLFPTRGSPNERLIVGVMGLNSRGSVLARGFAGIANTLVGYLCDVDSVVLEKARVTTARTQSTPPRAVTDIRRVLDDKDVDAIVIATPDHWHTPAALLALGAGKHVYLEKPGAHNPREDEMLVEAARKYPYRVQFGTQTRSAPHVAELVQSIREGLIGTPYLARAWYANTRTTIGKGKLAPVPAHLDYELWQGPAPRTPYRDNVIHYNWHWFKRWGTGEICNNGTHEIDIARLMLGVDYPKSIVSTGGRFHFADDWEFPDTQQAIFEFDGGKSITWQGQSCNGLQMYGRARGTAILGTGGSVVVDRDGYVVYDLKNTMVKQSSARATSDGLNTLADDPLTQLHIENFVAAVRTGTPLAAPIEDGAKTALLCHLGTISHQVGRKLQIDHRSGHIVGDSDAATLWSREYDPRWKPVV
jgi:predicted dehydrogenase